MMRSSMTNCDAAVKRDHGSSAQRRAQREEVAPDLTEQLGDQDQRDADQRRDGAILGLSFRLGSFVADHGRAADDGHAKDADDERDPLRASQPPSQEHDREDADPTVNLGVNVSFVPGLA